ncbi:Glycosyl transferase, group 1 [Nocardioides sp. PD653]|nr:Glycosyl transferase, group 1 [Nocardioides sp. PD653]
MAGNASDSGCVSAILTHPRQPAVTLAAGSRWILGSCVGLALLLVALPAAAGVPWAEVWSVVAGVPAADLAALVALWAVGLLTHTVTLTAALPRLSHRRALTMSLTGSAVANVLPMGGAAGIAVNYRMARHWGFTGAQFATYTVVTNAWDVLAKLALPLVAVPTLALVADAAVGPFLGPSLVVAAGLALAAGLAGVVLARPAAADLVGGAAERVLAGALRIVGSTRHVGVRASLVALQSSCSDVVRTRWVRLSIGMLLYTALLFALLWACLTVTDTGLAPAAVLAGFAVERLLTLAGITPGGAGVVEVGLAGALLALGGSPAGVVAGVVLYRALTFGLEIPVGGLGLAAWVWARRGDARAAVA